MTGMALENFRYVLRIDLKDTDSLLWSNDELDRSIRRAVEDLSRHLPRELVHEETLDFTVSGEEFATGASSGWVSLGNKPIKYQSETVTSEDGNTTYIRDTDYQMDYGNGAIKYLSDGDMEASTDYLIGYTKSQLGLDIGSLSASRITRVEYPIGQVPQRFSNFSIYGDFLYIGSQQAGDSQARMTTNHVAVWYEQPHTAPAIGVVGTYPAVLDQLVAIGAAGYALMIKALEQEHQAVTDLASLRTELGLTTAIHTLIDAALDKISTYLTDNSNEDTEYWLTKITTDITDLRTAIKTAEAAIATELGKVFTTSLDKATTGAEAYLDVGDANLDSVTAAPEADRYANYSKARADIASVRVAAVTQYAQEAIVRLDNLRSYIEQAAGWSSIASGFAEEAAGRLNEVEQHLVEARQWAETVQGDIVLSDRFRTEGQARLNEFESKLRNKSEYRKRTSSVSVKQPA